MKYISYGVLAVALLAAGWLAWNLLSYDTSLATTPEPTNQASTSTTNDVNTAPSTVSPENDMLLRANERLLEMVKWTIALVITIAALLGGFGWVQYQRNIDQDIRRLDEHRTTLSEEAAAQYAVLDGQVGGKLTQIDSRLEQMAGLQARLVEIESNVRLVLDRTDRLANSSSASAEALPIWNDSTRQTEAAESLRATLTELESLAAQDQADEFVQHLLNGIRQTDRTHVLDWTMFMNRTSAAAHHLIAGGQVKLSTEGVETLRSLQHLLETQFATQSRNLRDALTALREASQ